LLFAGKAEIATPKSLQVFKDTSDDLVIPSSVGHDFYRRAPSVSLHLFQFGVKSDGVQFRAAIESHVMVW